MMMALAGARDLPCVLVPGGVTLLAEKGEDAGKVQSVGRALRPRPDHPRRGGRGSVPRLRLARRRLPVPRHRGHLAGGGRGARHDAHPLRARALRAIPSGSTWRAAPARAVLALEARGLRMRDILTDASVRNAMVVHAAFGGSTNLILHLPAVAFAAGLAAPHGGRLDAHQSPGAAPGRRAAQRPASAPHRAGLPRRRRARSDAAPAPRRAARDRRAHRQPAKRSARCSTGGSSPSAAPRCASVLRERDGVDPDDVIMDPRWRAPPRPHLHRHLPQRQPRARRLGHQEHRHRPQRGGCGRRLPQDRSGARLPHRDRRHRRHQEHGGDRSSPATSWC